MSLKREMLINAGITDKEAIDEIMQAYGAGLEHARTQVKNELTAENDTLKQQLESQSTTLEELKKSSEANSDVKLTEEEAAILYDVNGELSASKAVVSAYTHITGRLTELVTGMMGAK